MPGCGGFIDISQSAKQVVFMGCLTSGGLKVISCFLQFIAAMQLLKEEIALAISFPLLFMSLTFPGISCSQTLHFFESVDSMSHEIYICICR